MQQRLNLITLGVQDLEAATKFYTEQLGWEKAAHSSDQIIFIQLNGLLLSLYPADKLAEDAVVPVTGEGFHGFTLAYLTSSKEEVDEIFATLREKGVIITKPPQEVFWGGYSGYFMDLDGHLWEVAFNPFLSLDDQGNVVDTKDT